MMLDDSFPEFVHNVPLSDELHIGKLEEGFATLDTYNTTQKVTKNLTKKVEEVVEERLILLLKISKKIILTINELC